MATWRQRLRRVARRVPAIGGVARRRPAALARSRGRALLRRSRAARRRGSDFLRRRSGRLAMALRPSAQVAVSIVVPAHNSDQAGLERLFGSLDAQSMPSRNYEVIVVDDGSTDDTLARLRRLARDRPHVTVTSIPNSGWSGRPRNVGVRMARGEYVLFMDHDDELYPRALERASAYGREHRADVVNPKEVRSGGWAWGWDAFVDDVPLADRSGPNPLLPMTPHKLYRRRFLHEHGIEHPEGPRVLWEDNYFNVSVYARGARVAILSRYPIYRWMTDTGSNSTDSFTRDADEYWSKSEQLLAFIARELDGHPGLAPTLSHYMRLRVLSFLGPEFLSRDEGYVATAMAVIERLVERHGPPFADPRMGAVDRARVEVVRQGDRCLQRRLAECDSGVTAFPTVEDLYWDGPSLVISATTRLIDGHGEPLRFRRNGTGWSRELPAELEQALSAEARDVTADLPAARFQLSVKGRASRSTWALPGTSEVGIVAQPDGSGVLEARATARFDPVGFAREHDLDDPVWDFAGRLEAAGFASHRAVRGGGTRVALVEGVPAISYRNQADLLSLDVSHAVRTVLGSTRPRPEDVRVSGSRHEDGVHVEIAAELRDVHCSGETRLTGQLLLDGGLQLPAVIETVSGRAILRSSGVMPPGEHPVRTRFSGRTGDSGFSVVVTEDSASIAPS